MKLYINMKLQLFSKVQSSDLEFFFEFLQNKTVLIDQLNYATGNDVAIIVFKRLFYGRDP